jgi:hypothetical protein
MQSRWGWVETVVRIITVVGLAAGVAVFAFVLVYVKNEGSNEALSLWIDVPSVIILLSATWFTWPRRRNDGNTP